MVTIGASLPTPVLSRRSCV